MRVNEAMTTDVRLVRPAQSIHDAARLMAEYDVGSLPVSDDQRLVGWITDRDIAVRAVAEGRSPDTPISEVMTRDVKYCFEDEDIDEVAANMGDVQLHRLAVLSRDKRLVGIVALADIAQTEGPEPAGVAVCGISEQSGMQGQTRRS